MRAEYPNLELIEYKFWQVLQSECTEFKERLDAAKESNRYVGLHFDVHVFPQVWGSGCTAFDVDRHGNPVMSTCAMTEAYTTVIHESTTDIYGVFIGNKGAYTIVNPTKKFFDDVANHNIVSLSIGRDRY